MILEPMTTKSAIVYIFTPSVCLEVMGWDADLSFNNNGVGSHSIL